MANLPLHEDYPECTDRCKSIKHGDLITSVITRRCVTDSELCSYISYICKNCENVRDSVGRNVIHVAVSCGRLNLVRWLINKRHINVNLKDPESGWTPLHRCLFYGQIHIGIELIKLGADINFLDKDNLTGLEHLMKDGCIPITTDDNCGEVYYWGTNVNNILGPKESRTVPELLDIFHKNYPNEHVREILIEKFHSVMLTRSNRLYSCGHGHGGRLGLGHQKPIIIPELIKIPDENLNCIKIAIAQDHSLFLCQDNYVYTCGLNTYKQLGLNQHQVLKPTLIKQFANLNGACCGHYHSCVWGGNFVYTWGLNGGQLGHKNRTEKYVQQPELINIINLNDVEIKLVNCSDAAISIYTGKGDIYIVHEYQCRKIASKLLNLTQIDVIGGKLNQKLFNKDDTTFINIELKVIALTNTGNLMLWQETDQQLLRCIYSINRTIIVKQVKLNLNGLLFVTVDGEAFQGFIKPRKRKTSTIVDGNFHKFLDKDDCISIKIRKFPRIHRAISIQSDPKGHDFCVIQTLPYKRFEAPTILKSEMQQNLRLLLDESEENDEISDVIFEIQTDFIAAHRYILASRCEYFAKLFNDNHERIVRLDNSYNPLIFRQFLRYIYTGNCELLHGGELGDDFKKLCESTDIGNIVEDHLPVVVYKKFDKNQKSGRNNPVRMLYDMSKKFGCRELCDRLKNLEIDNFTIKYRNDRNFEVKPLKFDNKSTLNDVIIKCNDGKEIKAHKCILSARSDYFKNLFSMRWHGNETSLITLPCSKPIIEGLLEFLYTDDLQFTNNSGDQDYFFNLLVLADQLFILRLKELCELNLYKCLTIKNAVQYLNFSHIYHAEKLKECCLQFIIDNLPPLLELRQFDNLDDDLLEQLTRFYCNNKPKISCRIITPYSIAPNDEIIRSISTTHPISMDVEIESTINKAQTKRRSRHKNTTNPKIDNTDENVVVIEDDIDEDAIIQFPDSSPSSSQVLNRLKAIKSAEEKIDDHDCQQFTLLTSKNDISSSFEDFPLLNSPPLNQITPKSQRINTKIVRISQRQRKRLSSETNQEPISESPKNPWKIIEPSSPASLENSFSQIVSLERKEKENLVKITSKSLIHTQIEDRAIEELQKFYNVPNIYEEEIIIERVSLGAIAVPVWVPGVKKLE